MITEEWIFGPLGLDISEQSQCLIVILIRKKKDIEEGSVWSGGEVFMIGKYLLLKKDLLLNEKVVEEMNWNVCAIKD